VRLLRAKNQIADRQDEASDRRDRSENDGAIDAEIRSRRIEKQQRAERKGNNPADPQNTETRKKRFADEQRQAQKQQRQTGVIERQHL